MTPHKDEVCDLNDLVVKQVATEKSKKSMIFNDEDGNIHDCLSVLGTFRLSPRLSISLKFKLYQMDVHNASLNRYEPSNEGVTKDDDLRNMSLLL